MPNTTQSPSRAEPMRREPETRPLEEAGEELLCYLKKYAAANPSGAALWCFGIGFVLGWKLKPW
ncbi:MAG TPA: hypothetical protein VMV69_21845 [Pirellulales bacterium]|nr:hypothetical protein [Pirellulales bacterium]